MSSTSRLWACVGAVVLTTVLVTVDLRAWALPALGQHGGCNGASSASSCVIASGITTGATIVATYVQYVAGDRTYGTPSDGINTYTLIARTTGGATFGATAMYYAQNVSSSGGALTISGTQGGGAHVNFSMHYYEIENADTTAPLDVFECFDDGGATTNHKASNAGITTAGNQFVAVVGVALAAMTTTQGTDYTETVDLGTVVHSQYRIDPGALTSNTGDYTSAGSTRAWNCMASFIGSSVVPRPANQIHSIGFSR